MSESQSEHDPIDGQDALDSAEDQAAAEAPSRDEELARLREALLRSQAEMDNLEKRTQRDLDKARKFMFEGLMRDLVPVIDSLDQALDGQDGNDEEGLALVRKLLLDNLSRHGLAAIEAQGQRFDPAWHEAMSMQPSAEHEPNTVLMVLQTGYRLHERLIRPARVIISAEPPSES